MVKQSVECISLTSHSNIIIASSQLLSNDAMGQDTLPLGHNNNIHHHIFRKTDGSSEVSSQSYQKMEDGHNVLSVNRLHTPSCLVSLKTQDSVGDSQHNL